MKVETALTERFVAGNSTTPSYLPAPSFDELSRLITENGGKVVDLNETKLTHIILDKRDTGRRSELMARTAKCVTFS